MSTNRFHKPTPVAPLRKFRCHYIGDIEFEVETKDKSEACRLAEDMLREEAWRSFRVEYVGYASDARTGIGPAEWQPALSLAEQGDTDLNTVAVEVGGSRWWLTDGKVALLGRGTQPKARTVVMVGIKVGLRVMPTMRANDGGRPIVRMGEIAWAQERYLWLVEELFGECSWHVNEKDTNSFSLVAVRNGEVVAVLMHCLIRQEVTGAVLFESAAAEVCRG
jgi:hypothetical protein